MDIGVVGLGKMGSALARRLLAQDVSVVVWNRSPGPVDALVADGAVAAQDLSTLWRAASTICTFLADDAAVADVLLGEGGLLATATTGATLVELSTISAAASALVADAARARDVRYVRAPVSGNPGVLTAGKLSLIVSGDQADIDVVRPVLELIGPTVTYVGEGEAARIVKLAVNVVLAGTAALLAEVLLLAEAWDIDRSVLLEVLQRSAVGSPFIGYKSPALLARDYGATFTLAMILKDLGLAHDAAQSVSVPMPVADLVASEASDSCSKGLADLDFMSLLPHLQHLAGRLSDVPVIG